MPITPARRYATNRHRRNHFSLYAIHYSFLCHGDYSLQDIGAIAKNARTRRKCQLITLLLSTCERR